MAGTYPWAGFEDEATTQFKFRASEQPLLGTDTKWAKQPKRDRHANLGSSRDSIRTLAIGSASRTFEVLFEPERFDQFEAMMGRAGTFTDWTRPLPDTRAAYVETVTPLPDPTSTWSYRQSCDDDNPAKRKIRTRITLLSQ